MRGRWRPNAIIVKSICWEKVNKGQIIYVLILRDVQRWSFEGILGDKSCWKSKERRIRKWVRKTWLCNSRYLLEYEMQWTFISWSHTNLVITREPIHKWKGFLTYSNINQDFCQGERKIILWTRLVEITKVNTNANLSILLSHKTIFDIQEGYLTSRINPASISLLTSTSI